MAAGAAAEQGLPVVVVGGGFIGLEVAATARKKGLAVTVVEMAPRLLGRVLAPVLSDWYASCTAPWRHGRTGRWRGRHRQRGRPRHRGAGQAGQRWPAGLVVVGIGVVANDDLARAAGLECERGIVVDACARTPTRPSSPPATAPRGAGRRHAAAAGIGQQRHRAGQERRAALLGQPRPFTGTPWFWSDQYDRKLQMAGLSTGADGWVLRGSLQAPGFSVWHYRGGRLIAVDTVNMPPRTTCWRASCWTPAAAHAGAGGRHGFDLAGVLAADRARRRRRRLG
jgi:3-phenylpropionate/trans-cinnamate dioxygenase ferredoxin reductase subunit